jgi:uncharacterized membrane protein YccC
LLRWLRELAATVGTFDRTVLEPGYALRCTIGVAIPLVVAALLGKPVLGVAAAIGAFITGFTSLQGIYRTRLTAVLVAALGMSLTSFVGAVAAHSTLAIVAATALAGYACGTIGQIGPVAATVALNSFVAFVLFSSQPLAPALAAQQSALVLAGGLIQAILVLLAWPSERRGAERIALADVFRKLAEYARGIGSDRSALPPITPLATARQILADPQPFARASSLARAERLLEDSEIIRRRLGAMAATADESSASQQPAAAVATQLDAIANVLASERDDISEYERSFTDAAPGVEPALDLAANLRDAMEAATMLARGRLPTLHLLSKPRPGPYVQNRIDWLSREALRFAIVLSVAMVIGRRFEADRGYWIPLTAALVLKPDFQTTFVRGAARIAGTLVGAVVASLAILLVRGHLALEIAGILIFACTAYLTFNPNYALFTVAITSFVVIVLSMRGLPGTTTIDIRVLDTLAGGALAMIGFLTFPSWERKRTRALLADLLEAQARLSDAILQAAANPTVETREEVESARTAIWKIRTTVEASIDRTRNEPRRPHTIGAGRALRILAATQRYALASLALETALEAQRPALAIRLDAFAEALHAEMAEMARALRESRRIRGGDRLPAALARLNAELNMEQNSENRFILERLRGYVEATLRLRRLLGTHQSAREA